MTKFIAKAGIYAALSAAALGNFWYTFGIWPRSWVAYFGFFALTVLLMGVIMAIDAEK